MDKQTQRKYRSELNRKQFPSEMWFNGLLKTNGVRRYHRNLPLLDRYLGDFVWIRARIVIEIDGRSHAGKEEYDRERDYNLSRDGWRVWRIKAYDLKGAENTIENLKRVLKQKPDLRKHREKKKKINPRLKRTQAMRRDHEDFKKFVKEAANAGLAKDWLRARQIDDK